LNKKDQTQDSYIDKTRNLFDSGYEFNENSYIEMRGIRHLEASTEVSPIRTGNLSVMIWYCLYNVQYRKSYYFEWRCLFQHEHALFLFYEIFTYERNFYFKI